MPCSSEPRRSCSARCSGAGRLLRPNRPQPEKYVTYEAGSDPVGGWGQSNVRYYVFALLFVMFDVEAVFIFPWAVNLEGLGVFGLVEMTVFIVILALGLVVRLAQGGAPVGLVEQRPAARSR